MVLVDIYLGSSFRGSFTESENISSCFLLRPRYVSPVAQSKHRLQNNLAPTLYSRKVAMSDETKRGVDILENDPVPIFLTLSSSKVGSHTKS